MVRLYVALDYRQTLASAKVSDLIYADPLYAGRHVDYFNSWSESDEKELGDILKCLPCSFILSTWHSNEFRVNDMVERVWKDPRFHVLTREHFYHVDSTEALRHPMVEALITNFPVSEVEHKGERQGLLIAEYCHRKIVRINVPIIGVIY